MKLDLDFVNKDYLESIENSLYYILMPTAQFLVNSKIKLHTSLDKPTHLQSKFKYFKNNETRTYLDLESLDIYINPEQLNEMFDIDIKQKKINNENINKLGTKVNISLMITFVLAHELLHYMKGDIYLTQKQRLELNNDEPGLSSEQKRYIRNVACDVLNNELLFELIENLMINSRYGIAINRIKENSCNKITIEELINDKIENKDKDKYMKKLNKILTKTQNSWEFYLFLKKLYIQNGSGGNKVKINIHGTFRDIDFSNIKVIDEQGNEIECTDSMKKTIEKAVENYSKELNKEIRKNVGKGTKEYHRFFKQLTQHEFFNIFQMLYKVLNKFGLLPLNDILENPDLGIPDNIYPVPKVYYEDQKGMLIAKEFYVKKYKPPKPSDIYIYLDVSGSIGEHILSDIKNSINKILNTFPQLTIKLFVWSTEVYSCDLDLSNINSTGGTKIKCVTKHIEKQGFPLYSNIIIISDGCWETFKVKFPNIEKFSYYIALTDEVSSEDVLKTIEYNKLDKNKRLYVFR